MKRISVLGAGQMGRGIAQVAAQAGYDVLLYDVSAPALETALGVIGDNLEKGVARGKVVREAKDAALARLRTAADLAAVRGSDLVIESVPEDVALKQETYRRVNQVCGPDILIASNTSSQSITELAAAAARPDLFVGMHFFNPVHLMRLVELVRGMETADAAAAAVAEAARAMGKEVVEVNETPGFVTSRMNALIGNEAFHMLEEGVASARDIDKAVKLGLNHPMGPFEMIDLVGLDTRLKTMEYLHATLGERFRPSVLHRKYVLAGRLGRKAGRGVYDYNGGEGHG